MHIRDARGERDVAASFPLDIGGDPGSGIQIPGLDPGEPTCRIVRSRDRLQIEPTTASASVSLNDRPLTAPAILTDGDHLAFDGARIRCRIGEEGYGFFIVGERNDGDTLPPPDAAVAVEETPIEPAAFSPADARGQRARPR